MEKNRAYEITNLEIDNVDAKDANYIIKTDGVEKTAPVPLTVGNCMNIYLGKEHKVTCQAAYSELRS